MGMVRHDAYTLLVQGEGVLEFINGLSTNLVDGPCTTCSPTEPHKSLMSVMSFQSGRTWP